MSQSPSSSSSEWVYRPNVAGIVRNALGEILICERLGMPGAWQFPQGGVDAGESHEEAVRRELLEEIGLKPEHYRLVEERGPYRYLFTSGRDKRGNDGQEQRYFLVDFTGAPDDIDLEAHEPEFQAFRWILPADFSLAWLPEMKRAVYRDVLRDFFQVEIK